MAITPIPGVHTSAPGPAIMAEVATLSDTQDMPRASRGLWVGGTGNVAVKMAGQSVPAIVTFVAVNDGTYLPISVVRVWATGTTATNIVVLF